MNFDAEIQNSVSYLSSEEALKTVDADAYWPKWNSPWWHMLLLHEMGATKQIPEAMIKRYVASLNRLPLKIFPIQPEDMPEGVDPYRGSGCHCQMGNVYQTLAAWGVDVDFELPWIRPWLLKYQMADGGMTCDNEAYLVKHECPSSMVGTIAAFEAILLHTPRAWTAEEKTFLDRAASFLMDRQLYKGSSTVHNASERESAKNWVKLCFPRFYLYDILRGLNALTLWAEKTEQILPRESYKHAASYIAGRFPDGQIKLERHSYEGTTTMSQTESGEWKRNQPATYFPLLEKVSTLGEVSPFLSQQWSDIQHRLATRKHPIHN